MTINPTVGRRIWYWPNGTARSGEVLLDLKQPFDAGIAYVHHDGRINVSYVDHIGVHRCTTFVQIIQEGELKPQWGYQPFAAWMPYQVGQAAKDKPAAPPPAEPAAEVKA